MILNRNGNRDEREQGNESHRSHTRKVLGKVAEVLIVLSTSECPKRLLDYITGRELH